MIRPDLDNPAAVDRLVDRFYERVLADPLLAPVFIEVAGIDLETHLPRIKAFWRRMLLGEDGYRRNMVARHAAVHARLPLERAHFDRWLALFERTLEEHFDGPGARHAQHLARTIAGNLARNLDRYAVTLEGARDSDRGLRSARTRD